MSDVELRELGRLVALGDLSAAIRAQAVILRHMDKALVENAALRLLLGDAKPDVVETAEIRARSWSAPPPFPQTSARAWGVERISKEAHDLSATVVAQRRAPILRRVSVSGHPPTWTTTHYGSMGAPVYVMENGLLTFDAALAHREAPGAAPRVVGRVINSWGDMTYDLA